jgi:hypothetical protein
VDEINEYGTVGGKHYTSWNTTKFYKRNELMNLPPL